MRELELGGITVSLFIDPQQEQVEAAQRMGVSIIEINTASYADASLYLTLRTEVATAKALEEVRAAAILADSYKFGRTAGTGSRTATSGP